jgi:uridine kinase
VEAYESVSTWRQDPPPSMSAARRRLIEDLASRIVEIDPRRLRVAVDGYTASGKTSFGHELATVIRALGRPTLRASLDDFKKPWRDAAEKGYDRTTGEGYYRNAPDFDSARDLLLEPAGPLGSGTVALCGHDPLAGVDHRDATVEAPIDGVLIVDSVFAMRPEYDEYWDLRIWLDVPAEVSLARGVDRDAESEGRSEAERIHRDRYHESERIYIAEVDPVSKADVVIDNSDFSAPRLVRG